MRDNVPSHAARLFIIYLNSSRTSNEMHYKSKIDLRDATLTVSKGILPNEIHNLKFLMDRRLYSLISYNGGHVNIIIVLHVN